MIDAILIVIIAAMLIWAVRYIYRNRKNGGTCSGCFGNCAGCSGRQGDKGSEASIDSKEEI